MRKLLLVLIPVIFIFLFFGCTESTQKEIEQNSYYAMNPCPKLPCNDSNNFNKVIREIFDFNLADYAVECKECAFPYEEIKGSYTKARLDFNGEKVELYYKEGVCSKLGVDCGWEVCISTKRDSNLNLIGQVKQKFCPLLASQPIDVNNVRCKSQILYDTNFVIDRCLNGYYESVDEEGRIFSVVQNFSTCGSYVQRGKIHCMD